MSRPTSPTLFIAIARGHAADEADVMLTSDPVAHANRAGETTRLRYTYVPLEAAMAATEMLTLLGAMADSLRLDRVPVLIQPGSIRAAAVLEAVDKAEGKRA